MNFEWLLIAFLIGAFFVYISNKKTLNRLQKRNPTKQKAHEDLHQDR